MIRFAAPLSLVLLAACAQSEEASLVPPGGEEGYNQVERVRTPERDDQEMAIGGWRRSLQDEQPTLEFGPIGAAPLFSMRCDTRRGLLLQRHGAVPTGDLPMMLLQIGSETKRMAVTSTGGAIPMMRAALAPSDSFVDTLAESQEPVSVRLGDTVPLNLPASPLIGAFVDECASGKLEGAAAQAPGEEASGEDEPAEPAANEAAPTG